MAVGILGAVCGVGCDTIALNKRDVAQIVELSESLAGRRQLADWWSESILCRFVREQLPPSAANP